MPPDMANDSSFPIFDEKLNLIDLKIFALLVEPRRLIFLEPTSPHSCLGP